jgi:hypothetical protein
MPRASIRALAPIIAQAQKEVAVALAQWIASVPDGDLRFTAQQHRNALIHLRAAFQAIRKLEPAVAEELISGGLEGAQEASELTIKEFARFRQVFDGFGGRISIDMARVVADGSSYAIPSFETSAARYANGIVDDIRRELAVGLVRGESIYEMTERLVRHGGPRGLVALRGKLGNPGAVAEMIAEGLFVRYRYWAERICRTEYAYAANHLISLTIGQLAERTPGLQHRWDSSLDGRTCPYCRALHNQTAPLNQPFVALGDSYDGAPAHPNCRCRVDAWLPRWQKYLDQLELTH